MEALQEAAGSASAQKVVAHASPLKFWAVTIGT
jgi:hypothetical protein